MLDEAEFDRDDAAPIDMLESYFAAHGWTHRARDDDEIVAKVKGSWTEYELRAIWREDDGVLQFLALPDIRVRRRAPRAIYETIGLVNEQLWIGHFELWSASGILLFRHAAMIDGERGDAEPARAGRTAGRKRDRRVRALLSGVPVRAVGRQDPAGAHRLRADRDAGRGVSRPPASLWLVGCGNMAGAMLRRWIEAGRSTRRGHRRRSGRDRDLPDGRARRAAPSRRAAPDAVMLGDEAAAARRDRRGAWRPHRRPRPLLISILAGVELATLARRFPAPARSCGRCPICRSRSARAWSRSTADAPTRQRERSTR